MEDTGLPATIPQADGERDQLMDNRTASCQEQAGAPLSTGHQRAMALIHHKDGHQSVSFLLSGDVTHQKRPYGPGDSACSTAQARSSRHGSVGLLGQPHCPTPQKDS